MNFTSLCRPVADKTNGPLDITMVCLHTHARILLVRFMSDDGLIVAAYLVWLFAGFKCTSSNVSSMRLYI